MTKKAVISVLCTNCFQAEYKTTLISKNIIVNNTNVIIQDVECEVCPQCKDTVFTHEQSLELDKKRINLEFTSKPTLTPNQLKLLRRILNLSLDEICTLLHIGKNTYGRWERGEIKITPSMNLLVHNFIEKFPTARVNLLESEMRASIDKAKGLYLTESVSLGEFLRNVIKFTKLLPEVVSDRLGIQADYLARLENNEFAPQGIPSSTYANMLSFFNLTKDTLRQLLIITMRIRDLGTKVSFIHTRRATYEGQSSPVSKSINRILERYLVDESSIEREALDRDYAKTIEKYLRHL